MPYRRRYKRKRRYTRKRRRGITLGKTVRAVKRLKNAIETKRFQIQLTTADIDNVSWDITQVNSIPQGDGRNDREGGSVFMKRLSIRGELISSGVNPGNLRFVVFLVKDTIDSVTPIEGDVFEVTDSGGTAVLPINMFKRWDQRYNIRTLMDKHMQVGCRQKDDTNDSNAIGGGPLTRSFHWTMPVNFKATWGRNSAGAGQGSGRLLFCYCNAHGTSDVQIRWSSVVYYTDS